MSRRPHPALAAALVLAAAATAALPHAAFAQDQQQQEPRPEALSAQQVDPNFLWAAAQAGMAEVQLSQLAAQQAKSQQVADFARRMVEDHTTANERLMGIAQQLGVTPPEGLSPRHLLALTMLEGAAGEAFDAAYLKGQIRDHEEAVDLYTFVAENGLDEQVRGFAEATLPTLREHLELARTLAEQLGIQESS